MQNVLCYDPQQLYVVGFKKHLRAQSERQSWAMNLGPDDFKG